MYEARTWKAYLLKGSRKAMAPVKGAMKGTLSLVASGRAAMLVGVPM